MIQVIKTFEGKGWSVRRYGAGRNLRNLATRCEAIQLGSDIALKEKDELYVHKADGMVDFTLNYNDRSR